MAAQVVDSGERFRPGRRQALAHTNADEQAADQAGPAGYGEEVEIGRLDLRIVQRPVEDRRQALEVVSRGELRHYSAKVPMQLDLGVDDVGQDPPTVLHDCH